MVLHNAISVLAKLWDDWDTNNIIIYMTIVNKPFHYALTIIAVITQIQLLYCSWFQPEMSRQLCEDILKKEVTMQTLIMLLAAMKYSFVSFGYSLC